MRSDARRNRASLLNAARDVFVEQGATASLEEIARRAEVSIATLYRHFPDRAALMRAVVLRALTDTAEAAEQAQRDHHDPIEALAAYVHAVLDLRTSVVIPTLLDRLDLNDPEINEPRMRSTELVEGLLHTAQAQGTLRTGVTFGDIALLLVRLSRPLPGSIPPDVQQQLDHRHADVMLAGLRATPSVGALPGPELELRDLQHLQQPGLGR
ncbi:helix-turn-helix domain-containing protein [Actinocatenispora sera]|uniref:TetR/AcrR family transcriptional regulator n=1 Tax=Actinocatenispora sera TaxID=390989 RepID=UPI0033F2ED69